MFHPIGSLPPSVYWRRRLSLLASLVVLIAMTIYVLKPGGKDDPIRATAADRTTTPAAKTTPAAPTTSHPAPRTSSTSSTSSSTSSSGSAGSSSTTPGPCSLSKLAVKAVVGGDGKYKVGDQPLLMLQVTNTATKPCV